MALNPPFANVALLLPFDTPGLQVDRSLSPVLLSCDTLAGQLAEVNSAVAGPFGPYSAQFNPGLVRGTFLEGSYGSAWRFVPPAKLDISTAPATIEVWVRLSSADALANRGGWILNCRGVGWALSSGNNSEWARGHHSLWMETDGRLRFQFGQGSSSATHQVVSSNVGLDVDSWHFVRIALTETMVRMWVDGSLVAEDLRTVAMSDYYSPASTSYVIGGTWNQSTGPKWNFVGNLGGLRITRGYVLEGDQVPSGPFPLSDPTYWPGAGSVWPGGIGVV